MSSLKVCPATPADLAGIMRVEEVSWGEGVGAESMASEETMRHRIALCNASLPGWFWVAKFRREVVADFVLQPTRKPPSECTGWEMATDRGQLDGTFDAKGEYVYGVSLAALPTAPACAMASGG